MKVEATEIPDVLLIVPAVHEDYRGYFLESFRSSKVGQTFVQGNVSFNRPWVLRGLHYQLSNPQGKFVTVIKGTIFDVAVDIRRGSPTFKKWVGRGLKEGDHNSLYVPPGFAHGFIAGPYGATVHYSCTTEYDEEFNRAIRWNDPDLAIDWRASPSIEPIISMKDMNAPLFKDAELPLLNSSCSLCKVSITGVVDCNVADCPREFAL